MSRSSGISKFSSQKKARITAGIPQASLHIYEDIGGSIPAEVVTEKVVNRRSGEQPSVCSSIGFDGGLTNVSNLKDRWTRHLVDASSFSDKLRGDDMIFVLEGLQKHFPNLSRVQDLEAHT